ncbi:MAG: UvrD-helicase domain-containing protein, partial [Planctomycetales bacterium]|nr:UvrD-helicase domain-containing protein [Planctomycetales bacterium]
MNAAKSAAKPTLTSEQRAALEAVDFSVSLSAGAGCGKTFVLTERFLRAVDPRPGRGGLDLKQLAAITFTDAAAREMRSRIRARCYERLREANDAAEAEAWLRLMRDIDGAQISTFHSFCGGLLRRFAVEADVDPQFELLDQATADLLHVEAVDDVLREKLDARDRSVLRLAADAQIEGLRENLLSLLADVTATPSPRVKRWLEYDAAGLASHWHEQFRLETLPAARRDLAKSREFAALAEAVDPVRADDAKVAAHLALLEGMLTQLAGDQDLTSSFYDELFERAKTPPFIRAPKWAHEDYHAAYRDACTAFRKTLDQSLLRAVFDMERAREAAATGLDYLKLVDEIRTLIERRKSERRQLEFNDLMLGVHRLLTDPEHAAAAQQAAAELNLLMVDEFQDTDPLQVELVQALAANWR